MNKFFWGVWVIFLFACNKKELPIPNKGVYVKFFGTVSNDKGISVIKTHDGDFVIAGSVKENEAYAIYVTKISPEGIKKWDYHYTGAYNDEPGNVLEDKDGNLVVTGFSEQKPGLADILVLKISTSGTPLDTLLLGDSTVDEKGLFATFSSDQQLVVVGQSREEGLSDNDMFLLKTDFQTVEWERHIGLIGKMDSVGTVARLNSGDLVWCGTVNRNDNDIRVIKTDDFGNIIWDYGFNEKDGKNQKGKDIQVLKGGGFIVAGSTKEGGKEDGLLIKLNANGISEKQIILSDQHNKGINSVKELSNGNFIVTGYKDYEGKGRDVWVAEVSTDGSIAWEQNFGGVYPDEGKYIVETTNGFLIIGSATVQSNSMIALYKIDATGKLVK